MTFSDGTKVTGQTKQIDEVLNMAVISVKCQELGEELRKEIKILTLGNSYSVKTGDIVIGVGGPSGQVHSMTYGTVSYIARNVQMTDGITRIIYADICSNSTMGTFLLNTAGEIIGWTSDDYKNEENRDITASVSISDYKPVIEKDDERPSGALFRRQGTGKSTKRWQRADSPGSLCGGGRIGHRLMTRESRTETSSHYSEKRDHHIQGASDAD